MLIFNPYLEISSSLSVTDVLLLVYRYQGAFHFISLVRQLRLYHLACGPFVSRNTNLPPYFSLKLKRY